MTISVHPVDPDPVEPHTIPDHDYPIGPGSRMPLWMFHPTYLQPYHGTAGNICGWVNCIIFWVMVALFVVVIVAIVCNALFRFDDD